MQEAVAPSVPTDAGSPFEAAGAAGRWSAPMVRRPVPTRTHGPQLLAELRRQLPTLSPTLRRVAQFCIDHASSLHHRRIQDVATACGTIPASVVRLAQKFGLKGFQDLKLAFLHEPEPEAEARSSLSYLAASPHGRAAWQTLERSALDLASLKALVCSPAFAVAVRGLRNARQVQVDAVGEADRFIAMHLQTCLQAARRDRVDADRAGPLRDGVEWCVQVAVWAEAASGPAADSPAGRTPPRLRLLRGPVNRPVAPSGESVDITLGADAGRLSTALAFCEALAAAVQSEPEALE
jgi:hypothetical protein